MSEDSFNSSVYADLEMWLVMVRLI